MFRIKFQIIILLFIFSLSIISCNDIPLISGIGSGDPDEKEEVFELKGKMLVSFSHKPETPLNLYELSQNNEELIFKNLTNCEIGIEGICGLDGELSLNNNSYLYDMFNEYFGTRSIILSNANNKKIIITNDYYRYSVFINSWHPNNKSIILQIADQTNWEDKKLFEYNIENGSFVPMCNFNDEICLTASYSPDGSSIIFSKESKINPDDDNQDLYLFNTVDKKETKILSTDNDAVYPVWSKNNKYILYSECEGYDNNFTFENKRCGGSDCKLYLTTLKKPSQKILVDDNLSFYGINHYDFSPDSSQIAYSKHTDNNCMHDIYIRNIALKNDKISVGEIIKLTEHTYHNKWIATGYTFLSWGELDENDTNNNDLINEINQEDNEDEVSDLLFNSIYSGYEQTCAIGSDNVLNCFGNNTSAQFGNGKAGYKGSSNKPFEIDSGQWIKIGIGEGHTCGIKYDETLWCWGRNESGQIGNGTYGWDEIVKEPLQITDDLWKDVSAGESYTCGIKKDDNSLWCWGSNYANQLGDNTYENKYSPVLISNNEWSEIRLGNHFSCGIKKNQKLWCWGLKELSNVKSDYSHGFKQIGNDDWFDISTGNNHFCGIKLDKSLWCLGEVEYDPPAYDKGIWIIEPDRNKFDPHEKSNDSWKTVTSGGNFSCGLKDDNTLWCWGLNHRGQLGQGYAEAYMEEKYPVQVGLDDDWKSIAAGQMSVCALKNNGELYCWGANTSGQLGIGDYKDRSEPISLF